MLCVSKCPMGTYLNNGTMECIPCHEGCKPASGCAGPLPYLDPGNGCLDCDLVSLISQVINYNYVVVMDIILCKSRKGYQPHWP